jgi:hypothetical protein
MVKFIGKPLKSPFEPQPTGIFSQAKQSDGVDLDVGIGYLIAVYYRIRVGSQTLTKIARYGRHDSEIDQGQDTKHQTSSGDPQICYLTNP